MKPEENGGYISDCGFHEPSDFAISAEGMQSQKKVWAEINELLIKITPDAMAVWK